GVVQVGRAAAAEGETGAAQVRHAAEVGRRARAADGHRAVGEGGDRRRADRAGAVEGQASGVDRRQLGIEDGAAVGGLDVGGGGIELIVEVTLEALQGREVEHAVGAVGGEVDGPAGDGRGGAQVDMAAGQRLDVQVRA